MLSLVSYGKNGAEFRFSFPQLILMVEAVDDHDDDVDVR